MMHSTRPPVLVIDDDKDTLLVLRRHLQNNGYGPLTADSAEKGIALALQERPALILLDVSLPEMDGFDAIQVLRRKTRIPILFLSGRTDTKDKILGLKLGADDYICKPFDVDELLARVARALKRAAAPRSGSWEAPVSAGRFEVDLDCHEVKVSGRPVQLTPKEFEMLSILIRADGKVVSRDDFLEKLWGAEKDMEISTRTVDQHIARLRRELKDEGRRIATVQGFGYKWNSLPR